MTATQAPTPGPLDSESVKLLVKPRQLRSQRTFRGYWIRLRLVPWCIAPILRVSW